MAAGAVSRDWPAPAKLNRFLHVVGRRSDGYHLLQTVFQFIDCCDLLHYRLRDDAQVVRSTPIPGVPADEDLVVRAARLLQAEAGLAAGVEISLEKRLPMGGGLGGGSSDAATTLVALNHLWGVGMEPAQLCRLGLRLGADVPVFVAGHAAWAEGVGEALTAVEIPEPWFVVVDPGVTVATAAVFADPGLTRNSAPIKMADFIAGRGGNDCEPVVYGRYPEVAAAAGWLASYGQPRLTGTGGCVFLACEDEGSARRIAAAAPVGQRAIVARGLNVSPLRARLAAAG